MTEIMSQVFEPYNDKPLWFL